MSTKWTAAQESAINTRGKTLLISAAAGSGKTATLTERVIRTLMREDGLDISRMLIVTYTRAAAAELKVKISKALSAALASDPKNHRLAEQMMMLESAKICTIDSFYFDVVKSHFSRLGLSGNLRIMDGAEATLLYRNEMETLIDDFYAKRKSFSDFMDHFVPVRGMDQSADTFLSIYQSLLSYKSGVDRLREYAKEMRDAAEQEFFLTKYGETTVKPIVKDALEYAVRALSYALDFFASCEDPTPLTNYGPAFKNDLETAKAVLDALNTNNYAKAKSVFDNYGKLSLKAIRGAKDEYLSYLQGVRSDITKLLDSLRNDYFSLTEEEISSLMRETSAVIYELYELLSEFDDRLCNEKKEHGICDFSDIRRYVLELLMDKDGNPTDIAEDYKARFDEIYIDEYQDVDEMQDCIFSAISTPTNRFMVGDIKQSIYAFRGADCDVFARYKAALPLLGENDTPSDGYSIFMSNNFRCDKNIIDFSNLVSSYLFSNCGESIGYRKEDDLIFSKATPSEEYESPKVTLALTGIKDEEVQEEEEVNCEAEYIAAEISRLLATGTKADGSKIEPRDIAILMRAKTDMETLSEILSREGILSQSEDKSEFFENPDILLMVSLLSTIDNPRRDIPLAGTLRSPFYGFSFDELIEIRSAAESELSLYDALEKYSVSGDAALCHKCSRFIESLSYWREQAMVLSTDKLIDKLYREFSVLSLAGGSEENLLRLYEYARSYEANAYHGLYSFIAYINEIIESGATLEKDSTGGTANAVQLMTFHHSKGLEFPVCFIYGTGKRFNEQFKRSNIQFEPLLGFGLLLHDSTGFAYTDTPVRRAIIDKRLLREREEEMRALYVAMTRARERLYITAKIASPESLENKVRAHVEFGKAHGIYSAGSYLEWIFSALKASGDADCYCIEKISQGAASRHEVLRETEQTPAAAPAEDKALTELFAARFSYVYPYGHVSSLPAKLSVSSLYPALLDESEMADIEPSALKDVFVYPESLLQDDRASGAEKGTATHTFLQFCDFDRVREHGVAEELARLEAEKFIDRRTASLCNIHQLEGFFKSELFERIQKADEVWREQRFNIFLPASEFTQIAEKAERLEGETIAVQGVIDLFFREKSEDLVLVDYKTDFLTAEELHNSRLAEEKLRERHREQLLYYKKAIEQICGQTPTEILIYSLPLAKAIPL